MNTDAYLEGYFSKEALRFTDFENTAKMGLVGTGGGLLAGLLTGNPLKGTLMGAGAGAGSQLGAELGEVLRRETRGKEEFYIPEISTGLGAGLGAYLGHGLSDVADKAFASPDEKDKEIARLKKRLRE